MPLNMMDMISYQGVKSSTGNGRTIQRCLQEIFRLPPVKFSVGRSVSSTLVPTLRGVPIQVQNFHYEQPCSALNDSSIVVLATRGLS